MYNVCNATQEKGSTTASTDAAQCTQLGRGRSGPQALAKVPSDCSTEGAHHASLSRGSAPRKTPARWLGVAFLLSALPLFAADPNTTTRVIQVHKDPILIYAQFRYNTIVVLPKGEEVLQVISPDKTFWSVTPGATFVAIKALGDPKTGHPGQTADVSIAAASGNIYTLLVQETTNSAQPFDLRVDLEQDEPDGKERIKNPDFVRAEFVIDLQKQLDEARKENSDQKRTGALTEVHKIRHDYEWNKPKVADDLGLRSIYHDDVNTYIELNAQDAPDLYEIRDGKDSLVQSTLHNGLYVVPKVLDRGYFRLGKQKVEFARIKESA